MKEENLNFNFNIEVLEEYHIKDDALNINVSSSLRYVFQSSDKGLLCIAENNKKQKLYTLSDCPIIVCDNISILTPNNSGVMDESDAEYMRILIARKPDGGVSPLVIAPSAINDNKSLQASLSKWLNQDIHINTDAKCLELFKIYLRHSAKQLQQHAIAENRYNPYAKRYTTQYKWGGWVFDTEGKLLEYTQPAMPNNAWSGGWIKTRGDEEIFKKAMRDFFTNGVDINEDNVNTANMVLLMIACFSLASLIRIPGLATDIKMNQILNLWGVEGGEGKTYAVNNVLRLWGDSPNIAPSLDRSTRLAVSHHMNTYCHHAPMFIDEITNAKAGGSRSQQPKELSPDELRRNLLDLSDETAKENSKMQFNTTTNVSELLTQRAIFTNILSNSNTNVQEAVARAKDDQSGPISARLIQIPVKKTKEANGVLLINHPNPKEFSENINAILSENYGFAVPYFVNDIKNNFDKYKKAYDAFKTLYNEKLILMQSRQAYVYVQVQTMAGFLLNYLGFDNKQTILLSKQLQSFIFETVAVYNNNIAMEAASGARLTTEDAVEKILDLMSPRINSWHVKQHAPVMGNHVDLSMLGVGYKKWDEGTQKAFGAYINNNNNVNKNIKYFFIYNTRMMQDERDHSCVGIMPDVVKNIDRDFPLDEIVELAKAEGWLVLQSKGAGRVNIKYKAGNSLCYMFDLDKARAKYINNTPAIAPATAIVTPAILAEMSDGDDIDALDENGDIKF